ncbi:MAG TPA: LPS export ABC transporter periplasmic protein LptC [bacterium]|jgi:LPS export ABC transporter protein LptC
MKRWLPLIWILVGVMVGIAAARIWQGAPAAELPPPHAAQPATPEPPKPPKGTPASPTAPVMLPPVQLEQGKLTGTDDAGHKQWELTTDNLTTDDVHHRVVLEHVHGQFYKQGKVQMTLVAARAIFATDTKDVELTGDVQARTQDGRTMRAPRARWEAARKRLVATGGVTVTQQGMTIRADQVVSDLDLKNTVFTGHVIVTVAEGK